MSYSCIASMMNAKSNLYVRYSVFVALLCWGIALPSCVDTKVKRVRMNGVTVNSFTRYSIDTLNIKTAGSLDLLVGNPGEFLNKFHEIIENRKEVDNLRFDYNLVRILYQIHYKDSRKEKILVDGNRCLMYKKSQYYVDEEVREFLISPIPEQNRNDFWSHKQKQ